MCLRPAFCGCCCMCITLPTSLCFARRYTGAPYFSAMSAMRAVSSFFTADCATLHSVGKQCPLPKWSFLRLNLRLNDKTVMPAWTPKGTILSVLLMLVHLNLVQRMTRHCSLAWNIETVHII